MTRRKKSFPVGLPYDERAETAKFMEKCHAEMLPRWRHYDVYLRLSPPGTFGLEQLLDVTDRAWADVELMWSGLPPPQRERFEDQFAPAWAEYRELEERAREKAKRHLAKHRERANGQS
jgi:hypothetical protein